MAGGGRGTGTGSGSGSEFSKRRVVSEVMDGMDGSAYREVRQ